MLVMDFCQKYGLSRDAVYVAKSEGKLPSSIFHKPINSHADSIDESYFLRRAKFRRKVELFNQSMYYILTEHFSVAEYAKAIVKVFGRPFDSVYIHLNMRLFTLDDRSILVSKVSKLNWDLFRFNRKVIIMLNRRYGIKYDPEKILDIRMMG